MDKHQRRAAVIAKLKPGDRADAFHKLMVSAIEPFPPIGDDAALDDLALAATIITQDALKRMQDTVKRDLLLDYLSLRLPSHVRSFGQQANQREPS
jgi:hypothetical protein